MFNDNMIHDNFHRPKGFKIGYYNVIEEKVVIGNNVEIANFVLLKNGTNIGEDTFIDSYVLSSGNNFIGKRCAIRYKCVLARNIIIEDGCFLAAGVSTIYLDHTRKETHGYGLRIGEGCFLGHNVIVMHGVHIGNGCVIGAGSVVTRDTEPFGVYVGSPARRIRNVKEDEIWKG